MLSTLPCLQLMAHAEDLDYNSQLDSGGGLSIGKYDPQNAISRDWTDCSFRSFKT